MRQPSYFRIVSEYLKDQEARKNPAPIMPPIDGVDPPERWFHSIDFGGGSVSRGYNASFRLRGMADYVFDQPVAGKSVLDIGAWDGFYSFEAERRGASKVVSTDHFCWSGAGWGTKQGYDYAHIRLGSNAKSIDVAVESLDPLTLGTFDVVLFLGVLYHLEDPYMGLKKAAALASDLIVIETVTSCNFLPLPLMRFYLGNELNNDPTNFWAPNTLV